MKTAIDDARILKRTHVLLFLLSRAPEQALTYKRAACLLYLADKAHILDWGRPLLDEEAYRAAPGGTFPVWLDELRRSLCNVQVETENDAAPDQAYDARQYFETDEVFEQKPAAFSPDNLTGPLPKMFEGFERPGVLLPGLKAKVSPEVDNLSESEEEILLTVQNKYARTTVDELIEKCCDEAYENATGNSVIDWLDIARAAGIDENGLAFLKQHFENKTLTLAFRMEQVALKSAI